MIRIIITTLGFLLSIYLWFFLIMQRNSKRIEGARTRNINPSVLKILPTTAVGIVLIFNLNGCAFTGKEYRRPEVFMPDTWKNNISTKVNSLPDKWWIIFDDVILNQLEEEALINNQDLKSAIASVDKARALARISKADLFPVANMEVSAQRSQTSRNALNSSNQIPPSNHFTVPVDFSYELDLWGKVRQAYVAGRYEAVAQKYFSDTVRLTLTADVANQYFLLRQLDVNIDVLKQMKYLRKKVVKIIQDRIQAGLSCELDLTQATAELETVEAQIVDLMRRRAQAENALALLCGKPASSFRMRAMARRSMQVPAIPYGIPSEILKNRPDIIEAENMLASANARVGVAKAAFFPSIMITSSGGYDSVSSNNLFASASSFWSLGPQVSLPLFDAGRNQAKLNASRANYEKAKAEYKQVILKAFQEVEDSLIDVKLSAREQAEQLKLLNAARSTYRMSYERYSQGLVNFLEIVDMERDLLDAQVTANETQTRRLIAAVNLIKSIGGQNIRD